MTDVETQGAGASPAEEKVENQAAVVPQKTEREKELEAELVQAQHKIVELKKKPAAAQPQVDITEAVRAAVDAALEPVKRVTVENVLDDELSKITTDSKVREAIVASYDSDIVKSGLSRENIRKDLLKAVAIATASTAKYVPAEQAHASAAQGASGASSHVVVNNAPSAVEDAEIRQVMKLSGADYDTAKKRYLANR